MTEFAPFLISPVWRLRLGIGVEEGVGDLPKVSKFIISWQKLQPLELPFTLRAEQ